MDVRSDNTDLPLSIERQGVRIWIKSIALAILAVMVFAAAATCVISWANTNSSPAGIVIHHTALTRLDITLFPGTIDRDLIDGLHRARGDAIFYWGRWYHIGYHYLILPDGTVESGRPEHCRGAHARGHNDYLGISLVGNFSSRSGQGQPSTSPTSEQLRSLEDLVKDLQSRYHLPCSRVVRHRDLNPTTECPGDRFPWSQFLREIKCDDSI
jgi:hypothetical protein